MVARSLRAIDVDGGQGMRIHRFENPFEHWMSGLIAEIVAFGLFILAIFLISVLIVVVL